MGFDIVSAREVPDDVTALAVGVASDQLHEAGVDVGFLSGRGFEGKLGQVALLANADGPTTVVVGLGPSAAIGPNAMRRAGGALARAVARETVVAVTLLDAVTDATQKPAAARALAEGLRLGAYRFATYKSDPKPVALERVVVVGRGGRRIDEALATGDRVADAVALARDLVNTPGGDLTPIALAEVAVELAEREGFAVRVLDEEAIGEAGMGGLLGVNRGSRQPARFVELDHAPAGARGWLALVGKGITFDSGGLSLKTAQGMTTMKDDMGGAAAIIGAFALLGTFAPKTRVTAYLPMTDNMTGGDATRVGDVLRTYGGTTVEVLNTDAEGRLILADGLGRASEADADGHRPDAIVDLATLTGAVEVALGTAVAGVFGTDALLLDQIRAAAERSGERVWELPLVDDYRPQLDSDVADLRNVAKVPKGGAILAGLFLREFVGDGIPWAHLDIAGTAWSESDDLEVSRGGTGWGVRLLAELAGGFRPNRRASRRR